jgi:hypothetical protein
VRRRGGRKRALGTLPIAIPQLKASLARAVGAGAISRVGAVESAASNDFAIRRQICAQHGLDYQPPDN